MSERGFNPDHIDATEHYRQRLRDVRLENRALGGALIGAVLMYGALLAWELIVK